MVLGTSPEYILGWEISKEETSKKIDVAADILIRMEKDADFSALVQMLYAMNSDQLSAVKVMLETAKQFSSAKHK